MQHAMRSSSAVVVSDSPAVRRRVCAGGAPPALPSSPTGSSSLQLKDTRRELDYTRAKIDMMRAS
jgi:hypothetical protein